VHSGSAVSGLKGVYGYNDVGGLVAVADSTVENCYADCDVYGYDRVGGLIGNTVGSSVKVTNSKAKGNVNGNEKVGGLIGQADYNGKGVEKCSASGDVSGKKYVGGLIGKSLTTVSSSHASGDVTSTGDYVGGLTGYNDGDVTALAGMITMNKKGILGVAMGSSEAVGYVDMKGRMTGRISELAFAPVDFNPCAPKDEWSGDAGVGAMAFSQQAVNWLAEKYGFKFPKTMPLPERLKVVQAAMEKGDANALKVYIQIGRFLAHAIPWYNEFYDYENMMILGRVTSGLGGEVILETAKAALKDLYPEWAEKIDIFMPDEKARRLGQSVAAAQIPVIKKGKK